MLNFSKKLELLLGESKARDAVRMECMKRFELVEAFVKKEIEASRIPFPFSSTSEVPSPITWPTSAHKELGLATTSDLLQVYKPIVLKLELKHAEEEGYYALCVKAYLGESTRRNSPGTLRYPILEQEVENVFYHNVNDTVEMVVNTIHTHIASVLAF